jgi:hypothetical protein
VSKTNKANKVNEAMQHGAGWFGAAIAATATFFYLVFDLLSK